MIKLRKLISPKLMLLGSFLCLMAAYTIRKLGVHCRKVNTKDNSMYYTTPWSSIFYWLYEKRLAADEDTEARVTKVFLLGHIIQATELLFDSVDSLLLGIKVLAEDVRNGVQLGIVGDHQQVPGNGLNGSLIAWITLLTLFIIVTVFMCLITFHIRTRLCSPYTSTLSVNGDSHCLTETGTGSNERCIRQGDRRRSFAVSTGSFAVWLLLAAGLISVPWEFIRTYQTEVAKKASLTVQGLPAECLPPDQMTFWQWFHSSLRWYISWSHSPCEEYHHALLVDPLWEVTPAMVIATAFSRCVIKPLEMFSSSVGNCFRLFFKEIPSPWQPVVMVLTITMMLLGIVMVCSYRVTMPLFFRIEPSRKTPIIIKTCSRNCVCEDLYKQKIKCIDWTST